MEFKHDFSFGYPQLGTCNICALDPLCKNEKLLLDVGPSYRDTESETRLMLIGQDPTIRKK